MKRWGAAAVLFALLFGGILYFCCTRTTGPKVGRVRAGVTLIGVGLIQGDESDLSRLEGNALDGIPNNRLGGHGSAIAYAGREDEYLLATDSGPKYAGFACRVHRMKIHVTPGAEKPVTLEPIDTKLLKTEKGRQFSGALDPLKHPKREKRLDLDPEGVRVGRGGEVFVSDEYGPSVYQFDVRGDHGKFVNSLTVPERFRRGRQENRGMEGLAISPDGTKLYGMMQSPLVQDGGREIGKGQREGVNCRILEVDIANGPKREFVYQLDSPTHSACEILAVSDTAFLVLERDPGGGIGAKFKRVFRVDIAASDVSGRDELPANGLPADVTPVKKTLFLDLLAGEYGIAGPHCPEKFEGLTFGPDLPDGRHLLLVTTDNDFDPKQSFRVYAFAIEKTYLPDFRPQQFDTK